MIFPCQQVDLQVFVGHEHNVISRTSICAVQALGSLRSFQSVDRFTIPVCRRLQHVRVSQDTIFGVLLRADGRRRSAPGIRAGGRRRSENGRGPYASSVSSLVDFRSAGPRAMPNQRRPSLPVLLVTRAAALCPACKNGVQHLCALSRGLVLLGEGNAETEKTEQRKLIPFVGRTNLTTNRWVKMSRHEKKTSRSGPDEHGSHLVEK